MNQTAIVSPSYQPLILARSKKMKLQKKARSKKKWKNSSLSARKKIDQYCKIKTTLRWTGKLYSNSTINLECGGKKLCPLVCNVFQFTKYRVLIKYWRRINQIQSGNAQNTQKELCFALKLRWCNFGVDPAAYLVSEDVDSEKSAKSFIQEYLNAQTELLKSILNLINQMITLASDFRIFYRFLYDRFKINNIDDRQPKKGQ